MRYQLHPEMKKSNGVRGFLGYVEYGYIVLWFSTWEQAWDHAKYFLNLNALPLNGAKQYRPYIVQVWE